MANLVIKDKELAGSRNPTQKQTAITQPMMR